MLIYIPSLLFPRTLRKISSVVLPAVIVARGPLRTYRSIDMSRTKAWEKKAKEAAKAAKAGVTLEEWRAANPRRPTKAAGGRGTVGAELLECQRIYAAHVALEKDGFVVLHPRGERGEDRRYEIPVNPQRDLGPGGHGPGPSHASIPCHEIEPIDWGAAVSEIWGHYHATLTDAASKGISAEQLTTYDPEEKLAAQFPGFQPRFGGRIDMDIPYKDDDDGNTSLGHAAYQLEITVKTLLEGGKYENKVRHIKDENGRFGLGVVVSRPGDAIQNWHQDGDSLGEDAGKTYIAFMTASRVAGKNLGFSQDALPGPLQIIKGSHKVNATPGMREGELPPQLRCEEVTGEVGTSSSGNSYLFEADEPGTICVMNYRCWHRGLANTSAHLMRPVLYMRFEVKWGDPANGRPRIYPPDSKRKGLTPTDDPTDNKKRRVTPTQLPCSVEELEPRGEVS